MKIILTKYATVIYCFILMLAGLGQLSAQNITIDSLENALKNYTRQDTVKCKMLYNICRNMAGYNAVKANSYADEGLALAKKLNNDCWIAKAIMMKGVIAHVQGDTKTALQYYEQSLAQYKTCNDKGFKGKLNINIAAILIAQAYYVKAITYLFAAQKTFEAANDTANLIKVFNTYSSLYISTKEYEKALLYSKQIIALSQKIGDKELEISGYVNSAIALDNLNNYEQAKNNFEASKKICLQINSTSTSNILTNMAEFYFVHHDYKNSIECLQAAKENMEANNYDNQRNKSYLYDMLGDDYTKAPDSILAFYAIPVSNKLNLALRYYDTALILAKQTVNIELESVLYKKISAVYESKKDAIAALFFFKKYLNLHDSLSTDKTFRELTEKEIHFNYSKKEDSLNYIEQITNSQLQAQLLQNKQNQQKLLLANKDKDLQHLVVLKTQADLQNIRLEEENNKAQLSLAQNEKLLQKNQLAVLNKEKEISKTRLRQLWLYGLGTLALFALIASFVLFNYRNRQLRLKAEFAKEKAEQQLKEAAITNKMNDIALSALHSQMNPHFLFNCLNSIKLYTMENNNVAATAYLGKFSKLMRNILDASRNKRITLNTELQSIKLYIELEAMRFKDKVQYQINVDENIDTEFVELPPLLIQPYIENAIWHGLMNKPDGGYVHVHISQPNQNILNITITDNGVGRAKANELKSKADALRTSYGTMVTAERIALLKEKYGVEANVSIIDLFDEANQPAGTKVIITLPLG